MSLKYEPASEPLHMRSQHTDTTTRAGYKLQDDLMESAGGFEPQSLNPKPQTQNPKPQTLNPKPQTLNPTPYTLHHEPCTLNPKPYTLNPEP